MPILKCVPVSGRVTQLFGEHPAEYARFGLLGHNGIDFGCPIGTPVLAPAAGVVMEATGDPDGYGEYIKVRTEWGEYLVAHLSQYQVTQGATVVSEQRIGLSGNTGNSTGPHLHFGMRINPYDRRDGQPTGEKSWGGFSDPKPYLDAIGSHQDLLGVHYIGSSMPTLEDVRRMQPSVCLFLDPNRGDVQAFKTACPQTKIVGRIYVPDSEVADRIRSNPLQAAAWAHQLVMTSDARGIVDYWQVANEVCQVQWDEFQNLVAFERERMRLADQAGYKCGIFAFSVGNPDMPAADKMGYWKATYPALDYAETHGHVLLIHEYGCCPNVWGPEDRGGSEWLLHRWEHQVRPYLRQRRLRIIVSEFGYDGLIQPGRRIIKSRDIKAAPKRSASGGNPGWKTAQTAEAYATDLRNVATYLERYSGQVLGYAIFQAGDGGTWANYDITGEVLHRLAIDAPVIPPAPPVIPPGGGTVSARLGKGIINQNMSVIPFDQRADFNPASMTPDTEVWRLIAAFTTHNGSWDPNDSDPWAIEQWAVVAYLFPPNDARYNREGGADHHLQICVQGVGGERIAQAGVAYSSDGPQTLQPASASVVLQTTADHGWANIPIYGNDASGNGSTSYPPIPGPWSMTKAPGMADILTGAGLPVNNHVSTFGVWQAIRYGDIQPVYATLREALLGEAARHWAIELNKDASLQKTITQTGAPAFVPTTAEFDVKFNGIDYVAQAGEHMVSGDVRVWYCPKSNYNDIRYEVR